MRLLLDSHVALWWLIDDSALGPACRSAIVDADDVFVSAVTPWELGIKVALGKLAMPSDLVGQLVEGGMRSLPITAEHAAVAPTLPPHHRDPFDRMLVAQAQLESLVLVTADDRLRSYDVGCFDARR